MKNHSTSSHLYVFSLLVILSLATVQAVAQTRCDSLIGLVRSWQETPQTAWLLQLRSSSGGLLCYYGAEHVTDPAHRQFNEIQTHWQAARPTLALYEGPNRGVALTDTGTIRTLGESGYVRFLANQASIRTMSLDPAPRDQYQFLLTKHPQQQVDLYFLLSETARLRTRKAYSKAQIVEALEKQFSQLPRVLGTAPSINTVAALETAYRTYWHDDVNWWDVPARYFDPGKTSAVTGGLFTNEINQALSHYRDVHMVKLLTQQITRGERVFAVVGRNHVPLQAAALRCILLKD